MTAITNNQMLDEKDPAEDYDIGLDWADTLPAGVSLAAVATSVQPSGSLTVSTGSIDGTQTLCRTSLGTAGETYTIYHLVTLSDGQTRRRWVYLPVRNDP